MTRTAILGGLVLIVAALVPNRQAVSQTITGEWEADFDDRRGWVHLRLYEDLRRRGQYGLSIDPDEFADLDIDDLEGSSAIRFELRRDAGTIAFDGRVRDWNGWGDFSFTPNGEFVRGMADMGYPDLRDREVFSMALHRVSRTFVRDLQALGYRDVDTDDLRLS
jgi:hypothetical protein